MNKTILIIIDGLRCDRLKLADTPHLDALQRLGATSFKMKSVHPYLTLPCHFSAFTSLPPYSHGVMTNTALPDISAMPQNFLYHVKTHGGYVSAFYSWEHLRNMSLSGTLNSALYHRLATEADQLYLAAAAADHIPARNPDFCFVYLEWADLVGHRSGWQSPDYIKAVETCDRALGLIMESIRFPAGAGDFHLVVISDHGGIDSHHMADVPEVVHVPFIACGPGIQKGIDIHDEISLIDVAPTLARMMNLPLHFAWMGTPVSSMFDVRIGDRLLNPKVA